MFTVLSTASMLGIMASTYYFQNKTSNNDHKKIKTIADNIGLYVTENKQKQSIRIYRKVKKENYSEYIYKIPLGLSFKKIEENKQVFIDGLNNKSKHDFSLANIKAINWKGDISKQLRSLLNNRIKLDKQIELEFDGMLRFRVYEKGLERSYLYNDEMLADLKGWQIPIGYTHKDFITHDFDKLQMLVVAGMTRYGKTVFLKNVITTLINNKPNDVKFTLVDLKGGLAFNRFSDCKQVNQVATNAKETIESLESIHDDILKQQKDFLGKGYEDITEARYKRRHFIVIDEGAEIAGFTNDKERERCTHLIGEIARIGAGLGYRLIFATQYPTGDVFPRTVKSNTSAALCFKLKNSTQSMVVLDRGGAENLPVNLYGRAIYQTDQDRIVQTPLIENDYIEDKIKIHVRSKEELNASGKNKEHEQARGNSIVFEEIGLHD